MKLYVGNIPFRATETDLQQWFAEQGASPDGVTLMRDKVSGEPRGFGFVEFQDAQAGEAAIHLCNGKTMMGRQLVINEARPPENQGGRFGRERRGEGRGRGPRY